MVFECFYNKGIGIYIMSIKDENDLKFIINFVWFFIIIYFRFLNGKLTVLRFEYLVLLVFVLLIMI